MEQRRHPSCNYMFCCKTQTVTVGAICCVNTHHVQHNVVLDGRHFCYSIHDVITRTKERPFLRSLRASGCAKDPPLEWTL
jgi:hypothetical protein